MTAFQWTSIDEPHSAGEHHGKLTVRENSATREVSVKEIHKTVHSRRIRSGAMSEYRMRGASHSYNSVLPVFCVIGSSAIYHAFFNTERFLHKCAESTKDVHARRKRREEKVGRL